jgi:hypothetical protein
LLFRNFEKSFRKFLEIKRCMKHSFLMNKNELIIKSKSKLEKSCSLEHDETVFVQIGIGNVELNNEIDRYHNV